MPTNSLSAIIRGKERGKKNQSGNVRLDRYRYIGMYVYIKESEWSRRQEEMEVNKSMKATTRLDFGQYAD